MTLIRGDALRLPLKDECVDLCVTSPPYFALRSYQDAGEHYAGQVGSEDTPALFLDALWAATAECVRVLKPSGSIFVNLGDKYCAGTSAGRPSTSPAREFGGLASGQAWHESDRRLSEAQAGVRTKSLIGLPWRYAIRCIDELGLILRAEIVWSKPNGLPESVQDRVRRSHETWFHFTREPRYYSAVDEIRESYSERYSERFAQYGDRDLSDVDGRSYADGDRNDSGNAKGIIGLGADGTFNPLGKLPGSVWTIPSEPLQVPAYLQVDHFAAFPQEWPRRIILGWSPPGICQECGEGRRPIVDSEKVLDHASNHKPLFRDATEPDGNQRGMNGSGGVYRTEATITGYSCSCVTPPCDSDGHGIESAGGGRRSVSQRSSPATGQLPPTRPAVVLDPFVGTGTVPMVARALGRYGVGVDLSADYLRLARWRIYQSGHASKTIRRTNEARQGALL